MFNKILCVVVLLRPRQLLTFQLSSDLKEVRDVKIWNVNKFWYLIIIYFTMLYLSGLQIIFMLNIIVDKY